MPLEGETGTSRPKSMTKSAPWLLLRAGAASAAENMAIDQAMLEATAGLGRPILRFYSWSEAAASFGYFQKYAEIERLTLLRPLVRRPTGGGLVPHAGDWTYCVAAPPGGDWYSLTAVASYERIHDWVRRAFLQLGVVTELAPCCRVEGPGQCFVGYEKSDVLWQGLKVGGAAQRRTRAGLLIQGSVQPPPVPLARGDWEAAMVACGAAEGIQWTEFADTAEWQARVAALVAQTYGRAEFHQRR